MRIWDIPVEKLCRAHLLGEHRELHAIWTVITQNKSGYSRHPETLRWKGKLAALHARHQKLVREMTARGYKHKSLLDRRLARGACAQTVFVDSLPQQRRILKNKGCCCKV